MSDTQLDGPEENDEDAELVEDDEDTETETAQSTETSTKSNDQNKATKQKHPLPEGYVTPVTFAKLLSERLGSEVRPQIIYGYIRNSAGFKEDVAKQNTDGAWMVNLDAAHAWHDQKEARKAERVAAKQAKGAEEVSDEETSASATA